MNLWLIGCRESYHTTIVICSHEWNISEIQMNEIPLSTCILKYCSRIKKKSNIMIKQQSKKIKWVFMFCYLIRYLNIYVKKQIFLNVFAIQKRKKSYVISYLKLLKMKGNKYTYSGENFKVFFYTI